MTTTVRTIFSINATDRSHDFLVIRRGPAGISIEAQSREDEWESATAGPFTPEQLRVALDEVAPAGSYTRTDEADWKARAEKAERERDEARADLAEYVQAQALRTQPHPLTPDAITDAMIERARQRGSEIVGALWDASVVEAMLTAALTEPPARPEGAEELNELIGEYLDSTPGVDDKGMADFLAERGVRVVTEGQP